MYTLIVKGDEAAAFAACRLHKVEITSIVKHNRFEECIVTTLRDFDERTLQDWFCEPLDGTRAAPAGTLMWYGPAVPRNLDTFTFFDRVGSDNSA